MQKVLTAEEMREVDRLTTEEYGIPSILLMENAAHATANVIKEKLGGSVEGKSFLILCGKGNNGGDGAALARILSNMGGKVEIQLLGKVENTKGDAKLNFETVKKIAFGLNHLQFYELDTKEDLIDWWDISRSEKKFDVIIDAVFGTGLNRPMEDKYIHFLEHALDYRIDIFNSLLVSLDLPSGLDAVSAFALNQNIYSDLTVTFTAPKIANVLPPASNHNGELYVANIGSPQELIDNCESQTYLVEEQDAVDWLNKTRFSSDSYKNKRGNALLIVGSKNYSGAAVLAGNAAIVTGVGLVTIATSQSAHEAVSTRVLPEVITQSLAETNNGAVSEKAFEKIEKLSEKADVIAIGSGLNSKDATSRKLVKEVVENRKTPIVIDADGLNALSPFEIKGSDDLPLILTPHEGEFLRLLGTDDKKAIKDRVKTVRDFAMQHNVILVLKGERTLIAEPNGKVCINPTGNPGLGKAGNGDNLTGIITGFIAQEIAVRENYKSNTSHKVKAAQIESIFSAVIAAVYVAGLAGDLAELKIGKRTMLASDVQTYLAAAFSELENL